MNEYINLKEHIDWLKSLEADGKITNSKIERVSDTNIEFSFTPTKPIEFVQFDWKARNNNKNNGVLNDDRQ